MLYAVAVDSSCTMMIRAHLNLDILNTTDEQTAVVFLLLIVICYREVEGGAAMTGDCAAPASSPRATASL
jgi:hypothetical protein